MYNILNIDIEYFIAETVEKASGRYGYVGNGCS